MARNRFAVTTEGEVALSAATEKTVLQIVAPANQLVVPYALTVSFDGVTVGNEPVLVKIARQTTAGTMSARTPVQLNSLETIQTTAQHTATVEPTTTDILKEYKIHPQSGVEKTWDLSDEIYIGGGTRLGFLCTAADAVNVVMSIDCEE
jgi:hypothetical protein